MRMSWTPGSKGTSLSVGGAPPVVSAENALKRAVRDKLLDRLIQKPSQGKAYASTCQSPTANHFLREGSFTRFTDWRFIHKARLNVLNTNSAKYHAPGTLKCRRCTDWDETLPHVLNHCMPNMGLITERHDRVLQRLYNALPETFKAQTRLNRTVPHSICMERPDLVVVDEVAKQVTMVDVTIPFDDGPRAMEMARAKKIAKYTAIARELTAQGYQVTNEAFVVGSLGSFPSRNFLVARALGINSNYAQTMARLMVSDTIRWSRDIYYTHVSGRPQEKPWPLDRTKTKTTATEEEVVAMEEETPEETQEETRVRNQGESQVGRLEETQGETQEEALEGTQGEDEDEDLDFDY